MKARRPPPIVSALRHRGGIRHDGDGCDSDDRVEPMAHRYEQVGTSRRGTLVLPTRTSDVMVRPSRWRSWYLVGSLIGVAAGGSIVVERGDFGSGGRHTERPGDVRQPAALQTAATPRAKRRGEHGLSQKAVEIAPALRLSRSRTPWSSRGSSRSASSSSLGSRREHDQVPSGAQNLLEWLVESLYGLLESIIGRHLVERTFWFFAHALHLHPRRQLDRSRPGRRHDWVGPSDAARLHGRSAAASRGERRSQHDAGDGAGVLRLLDRVGASGNRSAAACSRSSCAEGRNDGRHEGAHGRRVLRGRAASRSCRFCSVPCR